MSELPINQIAISVKSVQHTQRWYRDIFGFAEAGGTPAFIPSLGSADVQGVPGATSECWWLNDSQDFFQIELFEFRKPEPKPLMVPSREWHLFLVLYAAYVVGDPNRDIMSRLYIGEGTFNRTRRRALRGLARALQEMEQETAQLASFGSR